MNWPAEHPYVLAGHQTYGPSQWPEELPHAQAICEAYIDTMNALSLRLMQLLAERHAIATPSPVATSGLVV